ncbi:nucleotide exchange factor GrpE [Desulfococcaceae bacterium HSG8]|nr:nucleotide exchange factor GrpE [Desulfococcaceae bacterium HSG8]
MNDEDRDQKQLIDKYNELRESLHELEERYQALIETNLYGIQEIDIYGNITFMNSIQYQILGYEEGELRGKQIWDLLASDSERNELTDYLTRIALGEYAPFPWIGKYVQRGGGIIELKVDWNCRRDTQETVTGFISIIGDIVDREASLDRFQEEAEEEPEEEEPEIEDEETYLEMEDAGYLPEAYFEPGETGLKLDRIEEQLEQLRQEFESKFKYDVHKDKMIDKLHKELQEYKGDIVKKFMKSVIRDMIQTVDNVKKIAAHYRTKEPSENDAEKLLDLIETIPPELEDIFYRQGIDSYTGTIGNKFDGARQKVLKTHETSDKSADKAVVKSFRPGYEWDGKVIRPEMVAVYLYKGPVTAETDKEEAE